MGLQVQSGRCLDKPTLSPIRGSVKFAQGSGLKENHSSVIGALGSLLRKTRTCIESLLQNKANHSWVIGAQGALLKTDKTALNLNE